VRSQTAAAIADQSILSILESDRSWCAYALADLAPPWREQSDWSVLGKSLLLVYRGLSPPVLFGTGEPDQLGALFENLSPGQYWYTLRPTDFSLMQGRVDEFSRARMWRMRLVDDSFKRWIGPAARLEKNHLNQIEQLYAGHADRPDAYLPDQVEHGIYYGVYDDEALLAVAGTHVVDRHQGVAAVGNIFTLPHHRRRSYGIKATAAVLERLVELDIETIVLNVEMSNQPAIEMYLNLGFMPYCGFYEGIAVLT
jgi:ribosomal protein S18 acetylase RimI-like enzyme